MIRLGTSAHRQRCLVVYVLLVASAHAFCPPPILRSSSLRSRLFESTNDDDDDWLNDGPSSDDQQPSSFATRSQMPQFIDAFLEKERETRGEVKPSIFTHMIGIPMGECHQLQIELESVQRALLYHCPSLIHACIVPSMSRMPLLFVDASKDPAGRVTMELHEIVQKVVKKHVYVKQDDSEEDDNGVNPEGYKPLTMTFHKLQIDGEDNEALFTVADPQDAGLSKLQAMVADLQAEIQKKGWSSQYPPSDVQSMEDKKAANADDFLPRIPLMRLPQKFETLLRPLEGDNDYHSSEDGGNGISPVFWIKWEKDVMGANVRLREVGIYPRRPGMNELDEQTFYLPHETVDLPGGNDALSKEEKVHQDYNEERMKESERRMVEEEDGLPSPDGDFMDPSLSDNRQILEAIYGKDSEIFNEGFLPNDDEEDTIMQEVGGGGGAPLDDWMKDRINQIIDTAASAAGDSETEPAVEDGAATSSADDTKSSTPPLDDRIRGIVDNRPSYQQRMPPVKTNVPSLDDNPIFQAYRDGTLISRSKDLEVSEPALPEVSAFPSEDVLRGFWRVVRSPLTSSIEMKDESRSDNFVLRVDGTVSGGPVLDQDTFNKASGGTWRMMEALDETLLRIRLVIPPKKDRIMVWEGEIYTEMESTSNSASILDATSFGKDASESENEEVIKCSGEVSSSFCSMSFGFLCRLLYADFFLFIRFGSRMLLRKKIDRTLAGFSWSRLTLRATLKILPSQSQSRFAIKIKV